MNDKKSARRIKTHPLATLDSDSQASLDELLKKVRQALDSGQGPEAVVEILATQPPGNLAWDIR